MENQRNIKKFIVITSIFPPTEAIIKFSQQDGYELVVVGDKKSPDDWYCPNTLYLSVNNQCTDSFKLSKILPYNHYCRKMLGYLYAMKEGADYIIDTDDDNIPKNNWAFPEFDGVFMKTKSNIGFINIYNYYTSQNIWPRGLPLRLIKEKGNFDDVSYSQIAIGVWQGLADGDPDVDAIYRLTSNEPCFFDEKPPIALSKGTVTPFNTQNTIIRKELFPLMYLPTYVTFRFTDILRGLIAQPIMWLYDYHLGFTNATVIQERNDHDFFKDFISEIPMYEHCEDVIENVSSVIKKEYTISDNLFNAYRILNEKKIIEDKEIFTLETWLNDLCLL